MKNINPIIIEFLRNKGMGEAELEEFLSPVPKLTHDPFLLLNMKAGVDFVLNCIKAGKNICIYGDYDADGVTSIVILKTILDFIIDENDKDNNKKSKVTYFVPSRFKEGYGLSKEALKSIKEDDVQVVITVDCGAVSYEEVRYAREIGLEILVTDHHSVGDKKIDCLMINPKQEECKYPFKGIAGCGVAFKLGQGLIKANGSDSKVVRELLDVLAIGTIGDVVPLIDENRTFVKYGLNQLNAKRRNSIKMLLEKSDFQGEKISAEEVAFLIVPHINATGRMGNASMSVEFFLNEDTLEQTTDALINANLQRKAKQEETYLECVEKIETQCNGSNIFIIYAGDAHEGITGIVAGKIKEHYNRPTVIVTDMKDGLKGTSRSIDKINIHSMLKKHESLFMKFGGHSSACGFSMKKENLEKLRKGIQADLLEMENENESLFVREIKSDIELSPDDINIEFVEELEALGPFGAANERPRIGLNKEVIFNQAPMGKAGNHARFTVGKGKAKVDCVIFSKAVEYEKVIYGRGEVSIVGSLSINQWNGRKKVQIIVDDITEQE